MGADGVDDVGDEPSTEGASASGEGSPAEAADPGGGTQPLRDEDIRDALPEDLDAAGYVGPYLFPNNNRRRIPGALYVAFGVVAVGSWLAAGSDAVYLNVGVAWAGALLVVVGIYSLIVGWNLDVDEQDALVVAVRTVGFPVGHASAQMGWRGLLSRPTWRILLYSAEDPPTARGLVLVDGCDGEVIEWFVEDNPEDWSTLTARG